MSREKSTKRPREIGVRYYFEKPGPNDERTRCACGKYRKEIYAGIICERCGYEIIVGGYMEPRFEIDLSWKVLGDLVALLEEWEGDGRRTFSRSRASRFADLLRAARHEAKRNTIG